MDEAEEEASGGLCKLIGTLRAVLALRNVVYANGAAEAELLDNFRLGLY